MQQGGKARTDGQDAGRAWTGAVPDSPEVNNCIYNTEVCGKRNPFIITLERAKGGPDIVTFTTFAGLPGPGYSSPSDLPRATRAQGGI